MKLQDFKKQYDALSEKKNLKGEEAMKAVKANGYAVRFVHEQTEAICLEAVKQNGYALQYVHEQTEAICIEAVKQDGHALRYVDARFFENMPEDIIELNGVKYKRID